MNTKNNRRKEKRLNYQWLLSYTEEEDKEAQGQTVDVSSSALSFTCLSNYSSPRLGQYLVAKFSIPKYQSDGSYTMENFVRSGYIYRIDNVGKFEQRITVQMTDALPFEPGEQFQNDPDAKQQLKQATV